FIHHLFIYHLFIYHLFIYHFPPNAKSRRYVLFVHIEIPLEDLHRFPTTGPHRGIDRDAAPSPLSRRRVSVAMKNELLHARHLDGFFDLRLNHVLRDGSPVFAREYQPVQRDYRTASPLGFYLVENRPHPRRQRRHLINACLFSAMFWHDDTLGSVNHVVRQPEQVTL